MSSGNWSPLGVGYALFLLKRGAHQIDGLLLTVIGSAQISFCFAPEISERHLLSGIPR